MKIAVPIWNGNVSPVLDTAERLIVFEVEEGVVLSRDEIFIGKSGIQDKAKVIAENARILICGALSNQFSSFLSLYGVDVYPWVMGNPENLIKVLADGKIPGPEFSMPGCRGRHRRHCKGRNRKRNCITE